MIIHSTLKTVIRPKAKPKGKIVETLVPPDPIGPVGDFPPVGYCRFTRDEINGKNWRMCGHPVRLSKKGSREPWCPAHARITLERGDKGRESPEEKAIRIALFQKQQKEDILTEGAKGRGQDCA